MNAHIKDIAFTLLALAVTILICRLWYIAPKQNQGHMRGRLMFYAIILSVLTVVLALKTMGIRIGSLD